MMKYKENLSQSAECLRLVLPLMAKHVAPFNPISYTVWYEYVAGINRPLKSAIDAHLLKSTLVDEEAIINFYQKYIAELDEETARRVRAGFQSVLEGMSQSASAAGDQASVFGNALERWTADANMAGGDSGIDTLLNNTRQMQGAIGSLSKQLDDSQQKIEELRQEVDRAREDALVDGLTGLTNRKGFDLALDACLSSGDSVQKGLSILMADIDYFKRINDSYGHLFGDKVIKAISQILKDNVRGNDTAARFGGEEFVILLPDTPVEGAKYLAEKIRSIIEKSRITRAGAKEEVTSVTVSLGIALYCPGESAGEFIERVDNALYESKRKGRNLVSLAAESQILKSRGNK